MRAATPPPPRMSPSRDIGYCGTTTGNRAPGPYAGLLPTVHVPHSPSPSPLPCSCGASSQYVHPGMAPHACSARMCRRHVMLLRLQITMAMVAVALGSPPSQSLTHSATTSLSLSLCACCLPSAPWRRGARQLPPHKIRSLLCEVSSVVAR